MIYLKGNKMKNFWIIVDENDKSFIKRYNIVPAGLKLNHITNKDLEKLIKMRERLRDVFDIFESNSKKISI